MNQHKALGVVTFLASINDDNDFNELIDGMVASIASEWMKMDDNKKKLIIEASKESIVKLSNNLDEAVEVIK